MASGPRGRRCCGGRRSHAAHDDRSARRGGNPASARRGGQPGTCSGPGASDRRDRDRVWRDLHLVGPAPAHPDEVSRYLFRRVVSWGRSSNVFLGNGARLYLDVGSHPEYATAECSTLREALAQDRAGERIIEGLVEDAQARVTDEEIDGTVYAFKNNTDSAGNSYGRHENYLIGRAGDFSAVAEVFLPSSSAGRSPAGQASSSSVRPGRRITR